ncbi:MAG: YigZ family protein [Firmicutes bacterium]|nr:YigZ family protein [Bacillota bacterium]
MELINTYTLEIKKSKFIAYYYKVETKEEIDEILIYLKKEHKKARHIPFAYKIDNIVKKSDDKEPSNTAGTPIYNIIIQNDLNNVFIAVVRYFGGTLLGAGLLTRSYLNSAKEVIKFVK